ncbi:MAG TPA: class II aldolase/adducin family protein [Bryobacteraceae bacterium]|nr:class II aldolase/adducin family protein [Bryobacteraceae bacterium]
MREIEELLHLCRYAGASPEITQGAGGNVSVKAGDGSMWIKASGYRLSAVREDVGYLAMRTPQPDDLSKSVEGLDSGAANISMSSYLQSLVYDSADLRPSLETWFHAVLGRVVLHTHPIYANAFACMKDGREALETALPNPPAYVPYEPPGHRLGDAVHRAVNRFEEQHHVSPARLILENHGLITVAGAAGEAIDETNEILEAGCKFFGTLPEDSFEPAKPRPHLERWYEDLEREFAARGVPCIVRPARFERLYRAAYTDPLECAPIVPDDVVCNGPAILIADGSQPARAFLAGPGKHIRRTATILVQDLGFIFLANSASMIDAMEEQLLANVLVRELIARRGVCRPLRQHDIAELLAMDSEKYRQKVLANGGNECRS